MRTTSPASAERALGRFALALVAGLLLIALSSVHASLPTNALSLPLAGRVDVRAILPQGWGYFSGDARQPVSTAYVHDGRGWQRVDTRHQGTAGLVLGLDRSGRLAESEMAFVQAAADVAPQDCRAPDRDCLAGLPVLGTGTNPVPDAVLCGDVAVISRDVLPWAWADSANPDTMPATAVRVEMSC